MALGFRRCRRRHADRPQYLFVRPEIFAARLARCRRKGSERESHRQNETDAPRQDRNRRADCAFAVPDDRDHSEPANLQRLSGLGPGPRRSQFFGKKMPTTWLITLDSIVSVSFLFIAIIFWRIWSKKFPEPTEINKIAIGSLIAVTGMLSLVIGTSIAATSGGKLSVGWLIEFHVLNSAGLAK